MKLSDSQMKMLCKLSERSRKNPFMPLTAGERSTVASLDRRDLLDGDLFEKSKRHTPLGTETEFVRCVWLGPIGKKILRNK